MDSSHAQVAADIALGATASPARLTRSGHSTPSPLTPLKPAQLAFSATKSEVAWGAADDAAAAKKISDEAAAAKVTAMEEDLRNAPLASSWRRPSKSGSNITATRRPANGSRRAQAPQAPLDARFTSTMIQVAHLQSDCLTSMRKRTITNRCRPLRPLSHISQMLA